MRWKAWTLAALVGLALSPAPVPAADTPPLLTPAEATVLAYADARKLPAEVAQRTRYLFLGNPATAKEQASLTVALAGHCNQLSTQSDITAPRAVAGGRLLAVVLDDYGWKAATWDLFEGSDPYFYATVTGAPVVVEVEEEVVDLWPGGKWTDGIDYPKGSFRYRHKVKKKKTQEATGKARVPAPWLDSTAMGGLALLTGAKAPIVHASVFLDASGAAGDGRKPSYYDFLGIKDEVTYQRLLGVDLKKDVAFSESLLAAIGPSGVAQEARAVARTEKVGGGYWRTFDVFAGEGKDDKNALRILGSDKDGRPTLKFDASEQYGHLPNGLWAFGLFDAAGKRQDSVPDRIAHDPVPIARNNHRVLACVSCVRCHTTGGLQDLSDFVREVFTPPPLDLLAGATGKKLEYDDYRRLRQQYRRKLEPFIRGDRARYAAALHEATGLKPEEWARLFGEEWQAVADPTVDLAFAARQLGVTEMQVTAALDRQIRTKGYVDVILAAFLLPPGRRRAIQVGQWREAISLMESYLSEAK